MFYLFLTLALPSISQENKNADVCFVKKDRFPNPSGWINISLTPKLMLLVELVLPLYTLELPFFLVILDKNWGLLNF